MRIFTVGHSNHSIERFLGLIAGAGVSAVADVRSSPFSRFSPQFNREALKASLAGAGVAYSFLGDELGGRPRSSHLYAGGVADYEAMALTPEFKAGLQRVLTGAQRYVVALMCSEMDPLDCHRCLLVGRHLCGKAEIGHIHADGRIEEQADLEQRLLRLTGEQGDLLGGGDVAAAYATRSLQAAYRRT